MTHALIVKLSSIGDVVHALPVASALKRRHPSLRISWAVERWTAPLVTGHPAIDRVVVFPSMMQWPAQPGAWWRDMRGAVQSLRQETYDAALDLQGLAKSAIVSRLSRAPVRLARAGQREGASLVSTSIPLPTEPIHAVDEYLLVAKALGAPVDPVEFGLSAPADARASVSRLLEGHGIPPDRRVIVINPSAAQPWKQWDSARWSEVIDRLADAGSVVVIGSAAQVQAHQDIVTRTRRRPVDVTGQTTLAQVLALLQRAVLHLAPDTGTVHMAVALGTPVLAIYGPTSRVRVGPYRQPESAIGDNDLCGRGCPAWCRRGRRCLDAVTVDEVVERAYARLPDHSL